MKKSIEMLNQLVAEEKLELNKKTKKWLLNMLNKGMTRDRIIYLIECLGSEITSSLDGVYVENHTDEEGSGFVDA